MIDNKVFFTNQKTMNPKEIYDMENGELIAIAENEENAEGVKYDYC